MNKLLVSLLCCLSIFISSYTVKPTQSEKSAHIVQSVTQLIYTNAYVEAYSELTLHKELFQSEVELVTYHLLLNNILKEAMSQTNNPSYRLAYYQSLEQLCNYFIASPDSIQSKNRELFWEKAEELSTHYLYTGNSKIANLFTAIYPLQVDDMTHLYPIAYNYYTYLLNKKEYTTAGAIMVNMAQKQPGNKATPTLLARTMHLAAIGYINSVSRLNKSDYQAKLIVELLERTNELYRNNPEVSKSADAIHLLGEYASYYQLIGQKEKATPYAQKEKRLIEEQFGKEGIAYAWVLLREGKRHEMGNECNGENAAIHAAYHLSKELTPTDSDRYKFLLIEKNHKAILADANLMNALNGITCDAEKLPYDFFSSTYALEPSGNKEKDSYYEIKLKEILTNHTSTLDRVLKITELLPDLEEVVPFKAELIVSYLTELTRLIKFENGEIEELVALPSDYEALFGRVETQGQSQEDIINSLLGKHYTTAGQMSIGWGVEILAKKELLTEEVFADLLFLSAEISMKIESWEEAKSTLEKSINKFQASPKNRVKQLHARAALCKCYALVNEQEPLKKELKKVEKELSKINPSEFQTEAYVSTLNYLAACYNALNDYKTAAKYAHWVIELSKNSFNLLPYYYQAIYTNSIQLFEKEHYAACAESLLFLCKAKHQATDYRSYHNLLIKSLCRSNNPMAYHFLQQYMERSVQEFIPQYFVGQSQFVRDQFWEAEAAQIIELNMEVALCFPQEAILSYTYNNIILAKSLDFRYDENRQKTVDASDKYMQDSYRRMKLAQDSLHFGNPGRNGIYKNRISFLQSQLKSSAIQHEITNIHEQRFFHQATLINKDMVVVEFVMMPKNKEPHYYAYITFSGSKAPLLIDVCSSNELLPHIQSTKRHINQLYRNPELLYTHFWAKIECHLTSSIQQILLVPTGILNRINFSAIPTQEGRLADRYNLRRYSYTSLLATYKEQQRKESDCDFALFGGITYDLAEEKLIEESMKHRSAEKEKERTREREKEKEAERARTKEQEREQEQLRSFKTTRSKLRFLPHTQLEIDQIAATLTHEAIRVKKITRELASEGFFKSLTGKSPPFIHLATHGFYLRTKEEKSAHTYYNLHNPYHYKEKALLHSGLLLAGAQQAWSGKRLPMGVEDGIVTADEISRLDLSNTQVVVLSACDTALGDIHDTEGVLGLQRAFKKAGVGFVILSLWPVGDKQTALLMSHLYTNFLTTQDLDQALQSAMNQVKEVYPDPIHWAGFIAIR